MKKTLKTYLPLCLLILFELAVGILLFVDPEGFTTAVTVGFGILLLAVSAFAFVRYFGDRRAMGQGSVLTLSLAILTLLVGCFFLFGWALTLFRFAVWIYGVILTVAGVFKFASYVERKQSGLHPPVLSLIGALVSVVLGLFILINPFGATNALWQVAGVALIVEAVFDLVSLVDGLSKKKR